MRKLLLLAVVAISLTLVASAYAKKGDGHATYHKIKGGSVTVSVSAAKKLGDQYGIDIDRKIGPLKLKRGGFVYESSNSMSSDLTSGSKITLRYDTRGADGKKGGVTTIKISRLAITIGQKRSFMIGNVSGSSTVPGVSVPSGEHRVFNIDGGKMKKSKGSYAYKFSSKHVTFNSSLTNLMNTFGTPIGKLKASAKVDLGSISVKVK